MPWLVCWLGVGMVFAQEERPAPAPFEEGTEVDDPFAAAADLADAPRQILTLVEWIEMPQAEASKLLLETPLGFHADKLRAAAGAMIEAGTAKMLETSMVIARSGQKATTESIRERIYPTEYEPWELPNTVSVDEEMKLRVADLKMLANLVTPATPTAFETRNLGTTLEVEPTVDVGDRVIELRLAPEIVWEVGRSVFSERKDPLGNVATIEMPVFYALRVNTGMTVLDGHHFLAAVQSPKGDDGEVDHQRKVLVFVRCDVQVVADLPQEEGE